MGTTTRSRAQWTIAGLILAVAVGSVVYRLLKLGHLDQTAALFIGLPSLLALALALGERSRSATGMVMKGLTIALLLSGPLLGEGFICILMSAPLFYLVAYLVVSAVNWATRRGLPDSTVRKDALGLMLAPFLLMSLEGTGPAVSFPRQESVAAERVVAASPDQVRLALSDAPHFDSAPPLFLRAGFPLPIRSKGSGLQPGDVRTVDFATPSGRTKPLTMAVLESGPDFVRFGAAADDTRIAQWLGWQESRVTWEPVDGGHTRVTWTISYERRLDPAWYFGPWEQYAVGLAADYLIESAAAPGSPVPAGDPSRALVAGPGPSLPEVLSLDGIATIPARLGVPGAH